MNIERREPDAEIVTNRRTIVTALPLKAAARRRLAGLLDARVLDVREPCDDPDLVLTPACSPQLISALGQKYNGAQVVVVELDDWEFDIELAGPVKRILRSGAAAYLLADSIDELAAKIADQASAEAAEETPEARELNEATSVDDLIAAFLRAPAGEASDHRTRDE